MTFAELANERSGQGMEIERIGDASRIRPVRRSLGGVLGKFATFDAEAFAGSRGEQTQAERQGV